MNITDIARNILSWLDNKTIEKLYLLGLAPSLSRISDDQTWWHKRVELVSGSFAFDSSTDWKQTYQLVVRELNSDTPSLWNEMDNSLASLLLYLRGHRFIPQDLTKCADNGSHNILRFLLSEGSINPNWIRAYRDLRPIESAILGGHFEATRLLLEDPRTITPADEWGTSIVLQLSVRRRDKIEERVKIVKLLLACPLLKVNHSSLYWCDSAEIARELIADERVDPAARNNQPLEQAIRRGAVEVVRVLLEHPAVSANIHNEIKMVAMQFRNQEIISLVCQ